MSDANLSNDPIEQHLTVSGLIQNIVRDLGCRTIGDLCELDIKTVESVKGVGVKKVDEFRRLIENARQLAGQTIVINTVPKVDLSGIVFDQSSLLVFVPSILKVAFEQLGIDTVEKLLSLDISAIGNQPGWGEKKKTAAVAIKELYSRLATIQPDTEIELVGDLVPKDVLPADSIGCMLLDKFILGQFRDTLQGKALLEASDLRMLLSRVFRMKSTVVGLNEMEWRDVPLQVGVKVESVAEKYSLTTLGQIADFAMHGRVMDPQTKESLDVTREGNFGESSLTSLREELQRLESMGLTGYRKSIGCSLDDLECADVTWHDVPLRVNKRTRDFFRSQGVEKISEVHKVALRKQIFSKDHNKWLSVSEFPNFSERSIYELRDELSKLNSQGLERYRFGQAGSPKTFKECIDRALSELDSRQIEIVKSRCSGATQGAAGQQYSITRERARQIANSAFKKLKVYRLAAASLVSEYHETLPKCLLWASERIRNQLHLDETWHLDFLLELAELGHERLNATTISRIPAKCVDLLTTCLRKLTKDDTTFSLCTVKAIGEVLQAFKKAFPTHELSVLPLEDFADYELTTIDIHALLGNDWLRASIRSQIVDAGVNGIPFADIDTTGIITEPSELADFLGTEAIRLDGDIFRRRGEVYERADEVLQIVRGAPGPIDVEYIMAKSNRKWHQAPLVGNYLSRLYEVVNTGRGLYLHVQKLGMSVTEVKQISKWGSELLAGENRAVDGNELFDLFKSSTMPQKLDNAYQLVSIVAKHPDIRRLSNNLQLAHRASFDESELSLAKADPEIAAQWHPTKNGSVTPGDVRPNSFKKRWWKCEKGHEFEAMPVYRTRMYRECIGCQPRWTISKIRVFVASLRDHLSSFTPAELYVIFQQSGLLNTGGQARGFVRSLATGRFPNEELDKFVAGDESLVDQFLNDTEFELADIEESGHQKDDEVPVKTSETGSDDDIDPPSKRLPIVSSKAALKALDSAVLASTDAEALDFLISSAKAKVWTHAYRDPDTAVKEAQGSGSSEYSQRVRDEFLAEFREASQLDLPPGYTFEIGGKIAPPNLMQRHVAFEILKQKRFGNWSGTGAGKTLSAVLASRVCDSRLTVIWCPNAVVGDFKSGWSGEIRRIFADSDVAIKTWTPQ